MSKDDPEKSDLANDLLVGAERIAQFMSELLGEETSLDDVYYGASGRSKVRWPIGRLGKNLIASKSALVRHARKAAASRPQSDVA